MLTERSRPLGILLLATILGACGGGSGSVDVANETPAGDNPPPVSDDPPISISGSVGDGPIVGADVSVVDAEGNTVAQTTTDLSASYEVEVPADTPLPVTIVAVGGTDLVTGRPAEFPLRAVAFETGLITRNVTPYTTLALAMASCDGAVQPAELPAAWVTLGETLDLGLPADALEDPMTTPVDDGNVAPVLLSNEALGEIFRRAEAALRAAGDDASQADLVDGLACDLADGVLDGSGPGVDSERSMTLFLAALGVRLEVLEGNLHVDGAPAMGALDDALQSIRPGSGSSVASVVPSEPMIEQTTQALAAVQGVVSDESLTALRFVLEEASPTTARALVDQNFDDADRVRVSALAESLALDGPSASDALAERLGSQSSSAEPVLAFTANPTEVEAGSSVQLSWSSAGTDECLASGGWSGPQPLEGTSGTEALDRSTAFTLTCVGLGGLSESTVAVTVIDSDPPPLPTLELSASDLEIQTGDTVTLSWSSTDAVDCRAEGDWSGSQALTGSLPVGPLSETSTFAMICEGPGGTVSDSLTVAVTAPSPPPPEPRPEVDLQASANEIENGGDVTLSWSSSDATACLATGTGWSGSRQTSGEELVGPLTETTTFALQCSGPGGTGSDQVTVTVEALPLPEISLTASETEIVTGATTSLSWMVQEADSCEASGAWSGSRPLSGSEETPALAESATFTLDCTGPGGDSSASLTVTVVPLPLPVIELQAAATALPEGETTTLTWSVTEADSCTAEGAWTGSRELQGSETVGPVDGLTTFTLSCAGPGGESEAFVELDVIRPEPSLSFTVSESIVSAGSVVTLSWSSENTTECEASGGWSGVRDPSGFEEVGPLNAGTTFSLSCSGSSGNAVEMLEVRVESAMTLEWATPTQNVDGSALEDLAGYRIYVGSSSRSYEGEPTEVDDETSTSYVLVLASGTYYVAMTALDADGNESAFSNEVVKVAP